MIYDDDVLTLDPATALNPERMRPFHLAVTWIRLGTAITAVQGVTALGLDDPLVRQINGLRTLVWSSLYDQTTDAERDAHFEHAHRYLGDRVRA